MKLTKLEHACIELNEGASRLIIDPGIFAISLTNLSGITAVVITHLHPDHFDETKVGQILEQNPGVPIFTTQQLAERLPAGAATVPTLGQTYQAGDFTLQFYGTMHAIIMDNMPQDQNVGVRVNNALYYPGDSFTPCPDAHSVTAVPSNAPWMKLAEAVDFLRSDQATQHFPTHYGFMNEAGFDLANRLLGGASEQANKTYHPLKPGDTLEL